MTIAAEIPNHIGGLWSKSAAREFIDVTNPATGELLARTPFSTATEVDSAVSAAKTAFAAWRRTPAGERIQYLFKLKNLLEEHIGELARLITIENGKTLGEATAELRRAIENVEVACGIPMMMQGYNLEDVTARRRRDDDSAAARCGRRNHALQFPGDDSVLVSALCHRLR